MRETPKWTALSLLLLLGALAAPTTLAGTAASLGNFTVPLTTVIDWMTGDIGRLVATVVLALFGFYLWKKRSEDKAEKGLLFVVGAAIVLGAPQIIQSLGFSGATY